MNYRLAAIFTGLIIALTPSALCAQGIDGLLDSLSATGSLAVQAIQGTPDAGPIGITDVEISLLSQNRVIKTINTQLDEHGIVFLDDIPIDIDIQPVIRIEYAGVTYQEVGEVMGKDHPQQTVKVTCYEVTNTIPAWEMPMRQVMLSYAPHGIRVTEIMVIMNPDQYTWLGIENPPNKPITMALDLPKGAQDIELGDGFHEWCCTSFGADTLVNHLPLMPHITEMNFSYIIETHDGTLDFEIIAPAGIEQMIVMLPEEMHAHNTDGLNLGGTKTIADTTVRYYTASKIDKGHRVRLALSGLPMIHAVTAQDAQRNPVEISSELVMVVIGGLVFVLAAGTMFVKTRSK